MSGKSVLLYIRNSMKHRCRRIHRDPYEITHIYNYSSDFFVSDFLSLTYSDLNILSQFTCQEEIELDEDDSWNWNGKKSINEICCLLNSFYDYEKFVPTNTQDGLTQISSYAYLNCCPEFFSKSCRRQAIVKCVEAFTDSILHNYKMAFLNSRIPPTTIIDIDYPLEVSPFDTSIDIHIHNTTYYPGGIIDVFSKFGLVLMPKVNALILGFFHKCPELFRFGIINEIQSKVLVDAFLWKGYHKVLTAKIIQYAQDIDCSAAEIQWLKNEFNLH